jgi:DNA-binding NarL/FixJ family response regulator
MCRSSILIADDHDLVAKLCKRLIETELDVVSIVKDGSALDRVTSELKPDVIIVDIATPALNGLDAAQRAKEMFPAVKLIFLTMDDNPDLAAEAFRRGASGYLLKTHAASEIAIALRDVLGGMQYMSRTLRKDGIKHAWRQKKPVEEDQHLTERQREVLKLLAEGKRMREVGVLLKLTTRTVGFHKYQIMKRVGAKTSAELVRYAVKNHIIAA